MPLTSTEIAALDPNDPAEAAILQDEALYYEAEATQLSFDENTARRAAINARISAPTRGIKLARRS